MGIVSLRRTRTWARAWQTRSQKRHWQHCLDKPGLHFACDGHTMASLRCCWLAPGEGWCSAFRCSVVLACLAERGRSDKPNWYSVFRFLRSRKQPRAHDAFLLGQLRFGGAYSDASQHCAGQPKPRTREKKKKKKKKSTLVDTTA